LIDLRALMYVAICRLLPWNYFYSRDGSSVTVLQHTH